MRDPEQAAKELDEWAATLGATLGGFAIIPDLKAASEVIRRQAEEINRLSCGDERRNSPTK